jgi:hypothetical protein
VTCFLALGKTQQILAVCSSSSLSSIFLFRLFVHLLNEDFFNNNSYPSFSLDLLTVPFSVLTSIFKYLCCKHSEGRALRTKLENYSENSRVSSLHFSINQNRFCLLHQHGKQKIKLFSNSSHIFLSGFSLKVPE